MKLLKWTYVLTFGFLLIQSCSDDNSNDANNQTSEENDDQTETTKEPEHILDYFELLPISEEYSFEKYGAASYHVLNSAGEKGDMVWVDNGKDYIEFRDMNDEERTILVRIQKFVDADNNEVMGYIRSETDSVMSKETIEFYSYSEGSMKLCTKEVLEKPDKRDFIDSTYVLKDEELTAWDQMGVQYLFSHYQRDVPILYATFYKKPACYSQSGYDKPFPDLCSAIIYKSLTYQWDAKTREFELIEKEKVDLY